MTIPAIFHLGEILGLATFEPTGEPLDLSGEDWAVHGLVSGGSGSGKSRSIVNIALAAFYQGLGVAVIDKHGETARLIAAHIVNRMWSTDDLMPLRRLHFLQWSPSYCPRLDPFHLTLPPGLHPEMAQNFLIAAREARCDQVATHLNACTQATESFEATPRLFRNLVNAFSGCTQPTPRRRLPAGFAHVLLDVYHRRHAEVFAQCRPFMPPEIVSDIIALHEMMDNPTKVRELTESALNRFRAFFSSLIRASFSETTDTADALDLERIICRNHCLLVDLGESQTFSHLQGVTLGRMIASNIVETMIRLPADKRPPRGFLLILEEAGELLTDQFLRYLGAVRKFGCRIIICGQDLGTFRKKDVDLLPKLLSQCGVAMIYNQRYPADADVLARLLFQKSLRFEKLLQTVEREGPIEWIQVEEEGISGQESTTRSTGSGRSTGTTIGTETSRSQADQAGWNQSSSMQDSEGQSVAFGQTRGTGAGEQTNSEDDVRLSSKSESQVENTQQAESRTRSTGSSSGQSGSVTHTVQHGNSKSVSDQQSTSESVANASGHGWSKSKKWVHIPHKIQVQEETGQLREGPTAEQLAKFQSMISELPPRCAIVKRQGEEAILIRSADVPDAFVSAEAQARSIEWLKRQLLAIHPYLTVPDLGREDQYLAAFLAQPRQEGEDAIADEALIIPRDRDDRDSPLSI